MFFFFRFKQKADAIVSVCTSCSQREYQKDLGDVEGKIFKGKIQLTSQNKAEARETSAAILGVHQ